VTAGDVYGPTLRCWAAGWDHAEQALAHLVLASRTTCGRAAAPSYARQRLAEWVADLDDDVLDAWADGLVATAQQQGRRR
jgi:hypothetical protein